MEAQPVVESSGLGQNFAYQPACGKQSNGPFFKKVHETCVTQSHGVLTSAVWQSDPNKILGWKCGKTWKFLLFYKSFQAANMSFLSDKMQ